MPRKLSKKDARAMANARKTHRGGRPRIPTPCPKCGAACPSYRAAMGHVCA